MYKLPESRIFYFSMASCCLLLLGFGLYLEYARGLEPCPLCIFQRMAYLAIFVTALIATIHAPGIVFTRIYSGIITLAAFTGAAIAARQVWLQHLPPDKVPACGPELGYMLETFPLPQALKMILSGSGECAEIQWQFIGLSIAEWSLIMFILIAVLNMVYFLFRKQDITEV